MARDLLRGEHGSREGKEAGSYLKASNESEINIKEAACFVIFSGAGASRVGFISQKNRLTPAMF